MLKRLYFCLFVNFFKQSDAALLDAFVVKEIKDYGKCPWLPFPATLNITQDEDYESISICWRVMTTAYPHCSGEASWPISAQRDGGIGGDGDMFHQMLFGPVSGMSEDGKHAGFIGFQFDNNGGTGYQQGQVPWHAILYDNPLKIHKWQSFCISYSKKTQKQLFFHNGIKYLDFKPEDDIKVITKRYLEELMIARHFRGSFSDLQVYSTPMDENAMKEWTTCQYDKPGDVYEWDINKFNLTHNEKIVTSLEKVDTKLFCEPERKEVHLIGVDPISTFEGVTLCQRLNGKAVLLPKNVTRLIELVNLLHEFKEKTNGSHVAAWVAGISDLGEHYGSSHWYPPKGIYDMIDPDTEDSLISEESKKLLKPDYHTYHKLVPICVHLTTYEAILPFVAQFEKCTRQAPWIGRILCEFETPPIIRIKGLCEQSTMDRQLQLIDPKIGEGKSFAKFHNYFIFIYLS